MKKEAVYAVIGGGLGGATIASLLQQYGYNVIVFEQYRAFVPAGAGIHVTPNAMRIMRHIGLENILLNFSSAPAAFTSRTWDTGEISFNLLLNAQGLNNPYITVNRGDFHHAILSTLKPETIHYGKRLKNLEQFEAGVNLYFQDGSEYTADYVIGADGLYSMVRELLIGKSDPVFSGQVAFRSVIATHQLKSTPIDDLTKWWAEDRFVISYYLNKNRSLYYFVAGMPADSWDYEVPVKEGTKEELMAGFKGFHPHVQEILGASTNQRIWPLFERPPLPLWHNQRIVLLGDACHPMRPHMAQGAAMAMEDAAILVRCFEQAKDDDYEHVFKRYAHARVARTSKVQQQSGENTWLKDPMDPTWVFEYDAINDPIENI